MDRVTTTLIDLAEAAYDFESRDSEWLPGILASGLPLLDHGLGVAGESSPVLEMGARRCCASCT